MAKPISVKIVVVGDPGTGKTSLLTFFIQKRFPRGSHLPPYINNTLQTFYCVCYKLNVEKV